MGSVHALPGTAWPPAERNTLNLSPEEVQDAAGGYLRPADQLRELHARGFTRAYRSRITGKVVLERGHYEAVVAGQFGQTAAEQKKEAARAPLPPNRAGYRQKFGAGKKEQ